MQQPACEHLAALKMPSPRRAALLAALVAACLLLSPLLSSLRSHLFALFGSDRPLFSDSATSSFDNGFISQPTSGRKASKSHYKTLSSSEIESKFELMNLENCSSTSLAAKLPLQILNEHWQKVGPLPIYVYSAFYDVRYRHEGHVYNFIRILLSSVGKLMPDRALFCQFWFDEESIAFSVQGYFEEIWEKSFDPFPAPGMYHSYLLSCPVPGHVRSAPGHVSVAGGHCDKGHNRLEVQKDGLAELRKGHEKDTFALCVKGLDFQEDLTDRIIEWVEMNRIQGAKHLTFYVYSVHRNVWKTLKYYEKINFATVVNITLPGDLPNVQQNRTLFLKRNIWQKRRSELVSYNDCLYRNIYKYNFVIPIDIDEMIVPVKENTWQKALKNVFRRNPLLLKKYSSLSVPHVYFFEKWNTSIPTGKEKVNKPRSKVPFYTNPNNFEAKKKTVEDWRQQKHRQKYHMLYHTRRSANFSAPGHSVKSFVATKSTLLTFNHYALRPLLPGMIDNFLLSRQDLQLNHYQTRCSRYVLSKCISNFDKFSVKDTIMLPYSIPLINRVVSTYSRIFQV